MKEYERMKFMEYNKPALAEGVYHIQAKQQVTSPQKDEFLAQEDFYVAGRAYTLGADQVFQASPGRDECGDFSYTLPFLVLEDKAALWEKKFTSGQNGVPVPWMALIVLSSKDPVSESDITVKELLGGPPAGCFFPDSGRLPEVTLEQGEDVCHVVDMPRECFEAVAPSLDDMPYLAHVRKVNLAHTEDDIAAREGEFAVVMANRFVPTGEEKPLRSRVHLVSMLGMEKGVPQGYASVRLVSLYYWDLYSVKGEDASFVQLIEGLKKNTGIIGCGNTNEVLQKGYVPKKHYTRSGEMTYSLYRGPLIPYNNVKVQIPARACADGYLIYDPDTGVLDTSYAAAFQMGRLMALSRRGIGKAMEQVRESLQNMRHRALLESNLVFADLKEICKGMVEEIKK